MIKNRVKWGVSVSDVLVVREFPDVFLEDSPSFPFARQVESSIDLVPNVALIAKEPYQLAPPKM